jgi:hypothetical protein
VYLSILILFAAASSGPLVALSALDGRDARRRRAAIAAAISRPVPHHDEGISWTAAASATC